jgi:hypothetical protein
LTNDNIVFAKTRYHYDSYGDFFRLAELSGFPVIYLDEIDPTDASKTYIFSPINGEIQRDGVMIGWPDAKARIIHWLLEQGCYDPVPGVAETWCSDPTLARECGAQYVLMGSHPRLSPWSIPDQRSYNFDFIALSYWTHRRTKVRDKMLIRGFTFAPNGWHEQRHHALIQSQHMLHLHQNDGKPYYAPQRWCIAAAYHMPLISETLGDRGAFPEETFTEVEYMELQFGFERDHLNGKDTGEALYRFLCIDNPFRKCVERALG